MDLHNFIGDYIFDRDDIRMHKSHDNQRTSINDKLTCSVVNWDTATVLNYLHEIRPLNSRLFSTIYSPFALIFDRNSCVTLINLARPKHVGVSWPLSCVFQPNRSPVTDMALPLNACRADKSSDNLDVNCDPLSDLNSLGTPNIPIHCISAPIKSFDVVLLAGYNPTNSLNHKIHFHLPYY